MCIQSICSMDKQNLSPHQRWFARRVFHQTKTVNVVVLPGKSHLSKTGINQMWSSMFITARNEVGARLYFHRRVWFCSQGGSASVHAGIPPPPGPGTPPLDQAPPLWTRHPLDLAHTPPDQAPPRSRAYWEIRSTSGRYASYWNAILVTTKITCP